MRSKSRSPSARRFKEARCSPVISITIIKKFEKQQIDFKKNKFLDQHRQRRIASQRAGTEGLCAFARVVMTTSLLIQYYISCDAHEWRGDCNERVKVRASCFPGRVPSGDAPFRIYPTVRLSFAVRSSHEVRRPPRTSDGPARHNMNDMLESNSITDGTRSRHGYRRQ